MKVVWVKLVVFCGFLHCRPGHVEVLLLNVFPYGLAIFPILFGDCADRLAFCV